MEIKTRSNDKESEQVSVHPNDIMATCPKLLHKNAGFFLDVPFPFAEAQDLGVRVLGGLGLSCCFKGWG